MSFVVADIKKLRDITNAPMIECKAALIEASGDIAKAETILKKKGLAALVTKEGRETSEGAIFIKNAGGIVAIAEVKCETDFVANTEEFSDLGNNIVNLAVATAISREPDPDYNGFVKEAALKIRENMTLGKVGTFFVPENAVCEAYVHHDRKSAAVVCISGSEDSKVSEFAKDCCLHLVAFEPKYISKEEIPDSYIAEQTDVFKSQMNSDLKMKGKPENVLAGILQGKINKHLAEICFMDQMFIKDDKKSVKTKLEELSKQLNTNLKFEYIKTFNI